MGTLLASILTFLGGVVAFITCTLVSISMIPILPYILLGLLVVWLCSKIFG